MRRTDAEFLLDEEEVGSKLETMTIAYSLGRLPFFGDHKTALFDEPVGRTDQSQSF